MEDIKIQIPFVLNNRSGTVEVFYEANKNEIKSGFDLLKGLPFDVKMCIGYPTMRAYIKNFSGTGYHTASAWIQIITDEFYTKLQDDNPTQVITEVDIDDNMRKLGIPFFAMGYPAEIYDAPCNNLGKDARLKWVADTFLVTQPSRINDNTISYLLGFRWGYEESDINGKRNVIIFPINVTDISIWNEHLPMLKEKFPDWKFK